MSLPAQMSSKRERPEGKMNDNLMTGWGGLSGILQNTGTLLDSGNPKEKGESDLTGYRL